MATNSSEHLGLHLWEPTDQVLRTEFNQNWQKIDTAVAEAQEMPYVTGAFNMTVPNTSGTVVLTLDFQPSHILVSSADVMLIRQGAGGSVHAVTGDSERSYFMAFSLQGNQLKYGSSGSSLSGTMTLGYVAYR